MRGNRPYNWMMLLLLTAVGCSVVQPLFAQRPVRLFDPFYREETAKRTFFDRYAVTAELSYRPPGFFNSQSGSDPSISRVGGDALGVNVRFDYRLGKRVDIGAFVDAMGGTSGRSL